MQQVNGVSLLHDFGYNMKNRNCQKDSYLETKSPHLSQL